MSAEPSAATDIAGALRQTAITALLTFGLLLPLIGFDTVQNIRNELVLETRWPLLFALVAVVAGLRFAHLVLIAPRFADAARRPRLKIPQAWHQAFAQWGMRVALGIVIVYPIVAKLIGGGNWINYLSIQILILAILAFARWGKPVKGFVIVYPILAMLIAGTGAGKWIDNFGIQILIYVILGWGLNVVVGLAGLLDLGYVAFYAIGAYTIALLGKNFDLSFWMMFPLAGVLAAFWGVLLGFPVLRLRGDYLAVVTLAFGEIIRLVLVNWVPVTGGYAGVSSIPRPTLFGIAFTAGPEGFAARLGLEFSPVHRLIFLYYLLLGAVFLTAIVIDRLRRLPIGRAWEALREDEIACRSLGINTTTSKLTAFAIGAMFGGFAGAFFTARQGFISPESVNFGESAVILAIVVLGGMGSQVGVAIAAVAIIGGTELLREIEFLKLLFGAAFDPTQYRMLLFGFAMVLIIIWKPRGLIGTREPTVFLKERKAISADLVREGHG